MYTLEKNNTPIILIVILSVLLVILIITLGISYYKKYTLPFCYKEEKACLTLKELSLNESKKYNKLNDFLVGVDDIYNKYPIDEDFVSTKQNKIEGNKEILYLYPNKKSRNILSDIIDLYIKMYNITLPDCIGDNVYRKINFIKNYYIENMNPKLLMENPEHLTIIILLTNLNNIGDYFLSKKSIDNNIYTYDKDTRTIISKGLRDKGELRKELILILNNTNMEGVNTYNPLYQVVERVNNFITEIIKEKDISTERIEENKKKMDKICNDELNKIDKDGKIILSEARFDLPPPTNITIEDNGVSNHFTLIFDKVKDATMYILKYYYTTDNSVSGSETYINELQSSGDKIIYTFIMMDDINSISDNDFSKRTYKIKLASATSTIQGNYTYSPEITVRNKKIVEN